MAKFAYGYRPELGDFRDVIYTPSGQPLKPNVDFTSHYSPCRDQGQLGSCTGFGVSAAFEFHFPGFEASPLWLYYKERKIENTVSQDAGAEIRDGIKVIARLGIATEKTWPYDISKWKTAPPKKVNDEAMAKSHMISQYNRLLNGDHYRDCLSQGHPFVIGITVCESFESDQVAETGLVPMPSMSEQVLGGHCICVVGYTSAGDYICRNSWGTGWGKNGYFILPKAYLDNPNLASDAWVIFK